MKRTPLRRKTPLKAKSTFKRTQFSQNLAPKKRKVTKASKLRRKRGEWSTATADTKFSLYIRERDGKCLKCGTKEGLTCSHYHRRGHSSTRFDPLNCISLCWDCHQEWEGPKNPYTAFMINWLGQEEFINLSLRAGLTVKRSDAVAKWKEEYRQI